MLVLADWEVRIVKNCDRGLENAAVFLTFNEAFMKKVTSYLKDKQ